MLTDFSLRTRQGIEALVASVQKATTDPQRLAFLAVSETACWSRVFGWRTASMVLEPAVLLLLAQPGRQPVHAASMVSGAVAAVEQVRVPCTASALGAVAAAGQCVGYGQGVVEKRASAGAATVVGAAALWAAGMGLAAWKNRDLVPTTALGGAAVLGVAALAGDARFREGTTAEGGVGHGANLIVAAEGARLARNTLLAQREGLGVRLLEAVTLGAQSIGHMLLSDGIAR